MIRAWIAVALLAGSWMFGLDYFHPTNPSIWKALIACSVLLLGGSTNSLSTRRESAISLALLIPAFFLVPWPFKIIPLLLSFGLGLNLLSTFFGSQNPTSFYAENYLSEPTPAAWYWWIFEPKVVIQWLCKGAAAAGAILTAQSIVLAIYTAFTARSHDLPKPFVEMVAGLAKLLSIDATADGSKVVMHSMRQTNRLAATWELLLDPATLCFFVGGIVLSALIAWQYLPCGKRWDSLIRSTLNLTFIIIAWLPVRTSLLIAIYMYRVFNAEPDRPLSIMNHFFTPWSLLALLAVPAMIASRFLRNNNSAQSSETIETPSNVNDSNSAKKDLFFYVGSIVFIALATALITAGVMWNPVGQRLSGRVKVVERHSTWEPTTTPYDTTVYGEMSGYNYSVVYNYLEQYYDMSRILESDKIDGQTLNQCDVLIIKTPTARYSQEEVDAVENFVKQGGGLLVIGDHTNLYRMGTIMNDITRRMGFIFRDDLLFSNESSPYEQHFEMPMAAHPSLQYMPPMDFAVSCSIDPGFSYGRSVIASTGLWNMPPDYHMDNYHPVAQYCPEMRYGAFVQVWATWYGLGRAMAFTDSTIFSNFCVFQPGKAELMLGMIEWLNHANPVMDPRPMLFFLGFISFCVSMMFVRRESISWLLILAAGICSWAITIECVAALHRVSMPLPKNNKPMTQVVIDRTTSNVLLSKGAYTQGDGIGYGMLEQLVGRLGYRTIRQKGNDSFFGDALIMICPNRPIDAAYLKQLERYVSEGGKLLVLDTPENVNSTANSLLSAFGLSINHKQAWTGGLSVVGNWPGFDVGQANSVDGGKPVARLGNLPVAAITTYGKGSVLAVGFSSIFIDRLMGDKEMWMVQPDSAMLTRYNLLYALVRLLVENISLSSTAATSEAPSQLTSPQEIQPTLSLPELPIEEMGPQD